MYGVHLGISFSVKLVDVPAYYEFISFVIHDEYFQNIKFL
jgi:hypothetical protein